MILSKEKANLFYDTRTKLRVTCRGQGLFLHFGLSSELQPTQNIKPSIQMDTLETVTLRGKNWEFWPLYNRDVVRSGHNMRPRESLQRVEVKCGHGAKSVSQVWREQS